MKKIRFKKLINKYKNLVYNQAFYFTSNHEDAEDISQEVFLKLWNHLDSVKTATAKSWLLKVTRNACIDYSRKKREQSFTEISDNQGNELEKLLLDQTNLNPEIQAIQNNLMDNIEKVLNQLPEKIRSIVIMRDIQDQQYEIIAKTMDIPLNTVKVYLHRGRKFLSEYINQNPDSKQELLS